MRFLNRLIRREKRERDLPRGISKEAALCAYIIREYRLGRSLDDILDDPYLLNRSTEEQRRRLLERPEISEAVGETTAALIQSRNPPASG